MMLEEDHVNNDLLLKAMLVFYYFHYQPKSNRIQMPYPWVKTHDQTFLENALSEFI